MNPNISPHVASLFPNITTRPVDPFNPYVIDPHRYASQRRNSTDWIPIIHHANSMVTGILGAVCTLLLFFLLARRTPQSFKPYSKVLLLCCMTDGFFLFTEIWCQSRMRMNAGVYLITLYGPASHFTYPVQAFSATLQVTGFGLVCSVLPAQYYYRYYAVAHNLSLTMFQTLRLFLIALGVSLFVAAASFPAFLTSATCKPDFDYGTLWAHDEPVPSLVVGDTCDPWMIVYFASAIALVSGAYATAMYYGYQTVRQLNASNDILSERTKQMQAQLGKALLVQTIMPLFVTSTPLMVILVTVFIGIDTGDVGAFMMMILCWLPLLNSASSVYLIVPYRRAVVRMFMNCFRFNNVESWTSSTEAKDKSSSYNNEPATVSVVPF